MYIHSNIGKTFTPALLGSLSMLRLHPGVIELTCRREAQMNRVQFLYKIEQSILLSLGGYCIESLQFRWNDYLTLLFIILLIRQVCHFNQILLICSSACVVSYPMTYGQEKIFSIYCF